MTGQLEEAFKPDHAFEVDDTVMLDTLYRLQQADGLMCGLSTGINVAGAIRVGKELGLTYDNNVVTILCDSALRYATKQFNIPFLQSQNLPMPSWLLDIEKNDSSKNKKNTILGKNGPTNPFGSDEELVQCLKDSIV